MGLDLLTIIFAIPIMVMSSAIHEFAHAYSAYKLGDDTARAEGRMTINPFAHIDPMGFLFMVFARIGWSKPVPVNAYNFNNPVLGNALVSAAGPASNIVLAFITAFFLKLVVTFMGVSLFSSVVTTFLVVSLYINVSLALFNLLPIPPLDGSNIVESFLPKSWRYNWSSLSKYAPILLIAMVLPFSPLFAIFSSFWYNLLSTVISWILSLFGITGIQL